MSKDWLELEAERRIEEVRASGVEKLDLSGLDIEMVPASVAGLEQVNWFQFLPHRRVVDVTALKQLPALQKVNLWLCNELCDLSPLTTLANLQHLGLYDCQANLSPLASLATLQHLKLFRCHSLTNISLLTSFKNLKLLDLSWNYKLTDLSPLASQANLRQLVLDGCNNLSDLAPILKLPKLKALYLIDAIPLSCQPGSSILEGAKELEMLSCNSLLIAPNELASQPEFFNPDNCLPRLKAWRADLDQGQADNHRIKLFVLGNGSAGKTQICRRLNDQAFDPNIPSTHGIDLGKITLISANEDKPEIVAHVWDFGGQDIYHGTHALFMDERALFVIVWNPELETAQPYAEHGVAMRHRPLAYWLAMVRDVAGESAAVVVVQSKCDRQQDSVLPPLPAEHGLRYLRYTACSAKNQSGMSSLLTSIQDQAQLLLERYGQVLLPASWVAVGDTLRARCSKGARTLPRAEFETLCRVHHASAPPEVVLHYLHGSGEVFYRPGLFGDQLILDQQWALDGVYAVLNRQRSLPLLRRQGRVFDQEILDELVWRGKYSSNEQALFISLMEQCGACFPVNQDWDHPKKTHYLAPDLLPERSETQEKIDDKWRRVEAHLEVWLNYRFLHDGVMKALLCAIGRRAGVHAVYWRYGVCFFDQRMQATFLLEAQPDIDPQQPGAGRLVWQAHVAQENKMAEVQGWLEDLLSTVERNTQGQRPEVSWQRSRAHTPAQDRKASHHDDPVQRLQPGSPPDAKPTVYVSYGWGEANTELLAQLETAFTQHGCQLIYDKRKMRTGDWISAFMREIGQSRHVLVLLDDKYLRSPYCMRELLYLYQSSLGDKAEFCRRIVPCLPESLPLSPVKHRLPYLRHWKEEAESHQDLLDEFSLAELSPETRDEVLLVKDFCHRTDEMLAWIADTLMPRGAQALSADNFAAIFTALQNQGFPLPAATGPGQ
ncbi:COR domain-containing protein [Rivihabitans pingtungensis]|uniref:COR domain-containing protein n=1 Tax=Rivihabitans pingtungensis TaxID=1054498 RepID=UPI001304F0FD|nr:COR domain-containing protein [Rivihabitans pingtungensis]